MCFNKTNVLCKVEEAVARSFPDEEPALWRHDLSVYQHLHRLSLKLKSKVHPFRPTSDVLCVSYRQYAANIYVFCIQLLLTYSSVCILGTLVVVPDPDTGDIYGLHEVNLQPVTLSLSKRYQPHVLIHRR